jgi:HD domain
VKWPSRFDIEQVLGLLGLVLTLSSLLVVISHISHSTANLHWGLLAAFFLAIAGGEYLRVELPGSRETAPISVASALALAMTPVAPPGSSAPLGVATVVTLTAAAMAAGLLPLRLPLPLAHRAKGARAADIVGRLSSVAVAAALFRGLHVWHGDSALTLQGQLKAPWLALAMVVVSVVALSTEAVVAAVARAARDHAPLMRSLIDETRGAFGLTAALSTTGALIALAERPLGLIAIPLFLFPLLLTQFAVRRYATVRATYRQTIRALSRLTEIGGYTEVGHAARVAKLSTAIGRDLGLSEREVLDLEYAALLHDIGQVSLTEPIPRGATVMAAPADQRRIAHDGAEIVRQTGVLEAVAQILEAQTTPYRQVREFDEQLPVASRIIKVANAYEDFAGERSGASRRESAMERINLGLGYEYDPSVVDSLARVLDRNG